MSTFIEKKLLAFTSIIFLVPSIFLGLLRPFNSDESIFMYGGMLLNEGLRPYEQLWDHKGPLLYVLNSFGLKLNLPNSAGIPLLQAVFLLLAFIYILRASENVINSDLKNYFKYFFVTISGIAIYSNLSSFGTTELWSLPIQLVIYFLTLNMFFTNKQRGLVLTRSNVFFIYGFSLGAILLIRPNNGLGIAFCTVLAVFYSPGKRFKSLLFVAIGMASCLAFTIIQYLPLSPELLSAFFQQYFIYSFDYSNGYSFLQKVYGSFYLMINYIKLPIVFILFTSIVIKYKYIHLSRVKFSIVLVAIDVSSQFISGRGYSTYLLATFASCLLSIYVLLTKTNLTISEFKATIIVSVLMLSLNVSTVDFDARWHKNFKEQRAAAQYVRAHFDPADKFLYLGNNPYIFVRTDSLSISPIIYNYPLLSKFYRNQIKLIDTYTKQILDSPPKYVIQDSLSSCLLTSKTCYSGDSQYSAENDSLNLLRLFLKENYTKEIEISNLIFYRLGKRI